MQPDIVERCCVANHIPHTIHLDAVGRSGDRPGKTKGELSIRGSWERSNRAGAPITRLLFPVFVLGERSHQCHDPGSPATAAIVAPTERATYACLLRCAGTRHRQRDVARRRRAVAELAFVVLTPADDCAAAHQNAAPMREPFGNSAERRPVPDRDRRAGPGQVRAPAVRDRIETDAAPSVRGEPRKPNVVRYGSDVVAGEALNLACCREATGVPAGGNRNEACVGNELRGERAVDIF